MSPKLSSSEIMEFFSTRLPQSDWDYDDDADEMEVMLPGAYGREGFATQLDEFVALRLDPDTFEPLSLIIMPFSAWAREKGISQASAVAANAGAGRNGSRHSSDRLGEAAKRTLAESPALARVAA
jgi:hypothetical protein